MRLGTRLLRMYLIKIFKALNREIIIIPMRVLLICATVGLCIGYLEFYGDLSAADETPRQ